MHACSANRKGFSQVCTTYCAGVPFLTTLHHLHQSSELQIGQEWGGIWTGPREDACFHAHQITVKHIPVLSNEGNECDSQDKEEDDSDDRKQWEDVGVEEGGPELGRLGWLPPQLRPCRLDAILSGLREGRGWRNWGRRCTTFPLPFPNDKPSTQGKRRDKQPGAQKGGES
eukprot:1138736-Pelagomonas_calceolata.AAC.6